MDKLDQYFCSVEVTRGLPSCEHSVKMRCSDDPDGFSCTSRCDRVMACCSRTCASKCFDCQRLNDVDDEQGFIQRNRHERHPCQKTL
jgi:hypothetical protein